MVLELHKLMKATPQRISTLALAGVALFALIVVGLLVVRGRPAREPEALPPSQADYRIKEVRLQELGSGNSHWRLVADQAEAFEREGKTLMRNVKITIEEPTRTWTVTGDEGDLMDATKDVEVRKNVVLVSSDGVRLETETLRWQAKERRVWTTDPVTIYREGAVVKGRGLDAWMSDELTQVKGRVRATFSDHFGSPLALGPNREPAK